MKWITVLAVFAMFLVGPSFAFAEQSSRTGPVPTNTTQRQAPARVVKPKQENQIPKQIQPAPALGNLGAEVGAPQQQLRAERPPLTGVHAPSSALQQARPRAVYREITRRINIEGGVLSLPVVVYYGVPVILDVPGLGYVDVPEDEYARLYEKFSSSDTEQVQDAMSSLRRIKALEEAEVEAARRRPESAEPDDTQDLSEPIFFDAPSRSETRRRRLY